MLEITAQSSTTRVIYIGDSFIKDVLVDGKFPLSSVTGPIAIPGVSAWTMPGNVESKPGHSSHWHLSLSDLLKF
ncbi:hypothetical protein D5038_16065 [Verminephrobacter aporrectodeae subsp. tuberculatae]|nr:hypothetical protein [Verminephrobacter aporrectodeae subsp. tuberculatae]